MPDMPDQQLPGAQRPGAQQFDAPTAFRPFALGDLDFATSGLPPTEPAPQAVPVEEVP